MGALRLVSLTPERAVVGHAPRDKFAAEMALGHLAPLFEKVLARKVAVSLMQVKEPAPEPTRPAPGSASGTTAAPRPRPQPPAPNQRPAAEAPAPGPHPAEPAKAVDVEAAKAHPLVQRAAELLGAKIVRINPPARIDNTPRP
ncbi:MAG: hypothetical protein K2X91_08990 [Thermoleophilia bacterium]|nr:hypothetical protein [Thermoleophilia bacterium]